MFGLQCFTFRGWIVNKNEWNLTFSLSNYNGFIGRSTKTQIFGNKNANQRPSKKALHHFFILYWNKHLQRTIEQKVILQVGRHCHRQVFTFSLFPISFIPDEEPRSSRLECPRNIISSDFIWKSGGSFFQGELEWLFTKFTKSES